MLVKNVTELGHIVVVMGKQSPSFLSRFAAFSVKIRRVFCQKSPRFLSKVARFSDEICHFFV